MCKGHPVLKQNNLSVKTNAGRTLNYSPYIEIHKVRKD